MSPNPLVSFSSSTTFDEMAALLDNSGDYLVLRRLELARHLAQEASVT